MQLYSCLNYGGNCPQAFAFYVVPVGVCTSACFVDIITSSATFGAWLDHDAHDARRDVGSEHVPPDWNDVVLHAQIAIGERACWVPTFHEAIPTDAQRASLALARLQRGGGARLCTSVL